MRGKTDLVTKKLATIYTAKIQQIYLHGLITLSGFCEGAKLAHFVAAALLTHKCRVDLIISIDYDWPRPWLGAVLHVFTESSSADRMPELGLAQLTPRGQRFRAWPGRICRPLKGRRCLTLAVGCRIL